MGEREEYNPLMLSFSCEGLDRERLRELASVPSTHRPQPRVEKLQSNNIQRDTECVDFLEMEDKILSVDGRLIRTYCGGGSPSRPSELGLWREDSKSRCCTRGKWFG